MNVKTQTELKTKKTEQYNLSRWEYHGKYDIGMSYSTLNHHDSNPVNQQHGNRFLIVLNTFDMNDLSTSYIETYLDTGCSSSSQSRVHSG